MLLPHPVLGQAWIRDSWRFRRQLTNGYPGVMASRAKVELLVQLPLDFSQQRSPQKPTGLSSVANHSRGIKQRCNLCQELCTRIVVVVNDSLRVLYRVILFLGVVVMFLFVMGFF